MHEAGTVAGSHWLDDVREACNSKGLPLFEPPIPRRVVISDAAEAQMGLDEYPGAPAELLETYAHHAATMLTNLEENGR